MDEQNLFEEIVTRGFEEGVTTEEAYADLVEQIVDNHRRQMEMHDDNPLEEIEDHLEARFAEYLTRVQDQQA